MGRRRVPRTGPAPRSDPGQPSSYLLPGTGTEQSGRAEQEDEDEDREDQRLTPLRPDVGLSEFADDADDQSAEDRPGDVADAPEDGCRERVQPVLEPHLVI